MSRHCIAVHHVRFEDLGSFAAPLERSGYRITRRHASSMSAAEWRDADLVVVLGGPIGVNDTAQYPWLQAELAGLALRLRLERPTLGICLGAQLMAAAIGARVVRRVDAGAMPAAEIGWSTLNLHAPSDRLQALAGVPVLHWHGDNIVLPEGVTPLASTAHTPCQAFELGAYGLALQFHAEFDGAALEEWLTGHTVELRQADIKLDQLRADTQRYGPALMAAGRQLLHEWLSTLKGST